MRWTSKLQEKATAITETLVVSLVEILNRNTKSKHLRWIILYITIKEQKRFDLLES